jgi:phosphopantothenoylcysteine decarboxylase/phosphopantothenate--cysteine ligase
VETTADLARAVDRHLPEADVLVMAAAPADFRPADPSATKTGREQGAVRLVLEPTPDVLTDTRSRRKRGALMVGFAYETANGEAKARAKLQRKGLDLIVLNLNEAGAGAEVETNRITLVTRERADPGPLETKEQAAERILDAIERLL